ncbi:MAG TPA: peptidoglycan-binding domain-containing protein [Ilumatobacteraceae bacterium]
MGRAARVALAVVVIAGAGAGGIAYARTRPTKTAAAASAAKVAPKLSTTKVVKKDLITYNETTATLGFAVSATVLSPVEGTITGTVAAGDIVDAGSTVATINGLPVVAMIGDVPGYRDLSAGVVDGADVRELKENLVALGFDPAHTIRINETYDTATRNVVKLWQASLGITVDGDVPQSLVVYIPGKLLVDTVSATIGGAAKVGSTLFTGRQEERKFLLASTVGTGTGGILTSIAPPGTPVKTGTVLFWESLVPVVAIEGDPAVTPALGRDLSVGVTDGADVKLFEGMLKAGGFDPTNAMVVDDHFDAATEAATVAWWKSVGLTHDPTKPVVVQAGSYIVVPSGLFTGKPLVSEGVQLPNDEVVDTLTSAARQVTTTAPVGDATFKVGAKIDVEFPDGTIQTGTVVTVGNVATNTSNTPGSTPSVPITIQVDNIPASVDNFVEIPVTLQAVDQSVPGAFVIPVSALVALAEGGYAVEVVDGKSADGTAVTHLIGVTPGVFSDGFLAVTGKGLADGLTIVVPS